MRDIPINEIFSLFETNNPKFQCSKKIVLLLFSAKYQTARLWQVDMKIPRRNVGATGQYFSAPIRDRTSLWPRGVIPYTIAYSIRKLLIERFRIAFNLRQTSNVRFAFMFS